MSNENEACFNSEHHHWSGWPGAFCLKCGSEDPYEIALADGEIEFDQDWSDEEDCFINHRYEVSPEVQKELDAANICPVKGRLLWNEVRKSFDLEQPNGEIIEFYKNNLGQSE